jgi:hypothetical protein
MRVCLAFDMAHEARIMCSAQDEAVYVRLEPFREHARLHCFGSVILVVLRLRMRSYK